MHFCDNAASCCEGRINSQSNAMYSGGFFTGIAAESRVVWQYSHRHLW
ncbi:hypothetical protein HYS47_03185 [Candidatus Woesearchaeota archaeon]|nr:hypothetical protein [Candidatus Woesearchaeota archaeon]